MPKSKKDIFLVVDANSLMHRSFHALPPFSTKDGKIVNAVYGFVSALLKAIKDFSPKYIVCAFDLPGGTFRHEEYRDYKATREKAAQELYDQFPIVKEVLEAMNIAVVQKEKYEADDIIGTIVSHKEKNVEYIIVTSDMDAMQLVSDQTKVYRLRKGVTDLALYDAAAVKDKYGLTPEQIVDYKALRGDPSDNIPGVKGVGEKTAVQLLQDFKTLDGVYDAAAAQHENIKPAVLKKLLASKDDAFLSRRLAQIIHDAPVDVDLSNVGWGQIDEQKVVKKFQELEFKSLLARIPKAATTTTKESKQPVVDSQKAPAPKQGKESYILIANDSDFKQFLSAFTKQKRFAIDTETTSTDPLQAELLGVSISWKKGEAYYLAVEGHKKWLSDLKPIIEDVKKEKVGHNIKYDYHVLREVGIDMAPLSFDTMVASYLIRPGLRQYSLDNIAFKELGYRMQPIEDLIGKGKKQISMKDVDLEKVSWYACEDADITFQLAELLKPQLLEHDLAKLFETIEMPLVSVLAGVERNGVEIDEEFLSAMETSLAKNIGQLEKNIYTEAGREFNINSPIQLKEILFDEIGLSTEGLAKTKTGVSTAASELEKMQGTHPIIDSIMEYRELTKLQSTYVVALPKLVNPKTTRLHTSYNQTVAATGRLSSSDPNLQNIPIRTELGNEIRKAFVAGKGMKLLSVDYSQVELRIVASLAKDEKMIEAFNNNEDIHQRTAAYMFEVDLDKVTKEMRYSAKEVNFGVLYGMGAWGLASRRKISRVKAQEFIERYFSVYQQVYEFLEQTKVQAQENGYVETLMGRKRYLPEIYSEMRQVRAQAERMAVNFPVQGTAADIMKMAMIQIAKKLQTIDSATKMILQVHDELVFEVPHERVGNVAKEVKAIMESVASLAVPLRADAKAGNNWGEMENL